MRFDVGVAYDRDLPGQTYLAAFAFPVLLQPLHNIPH